ncbi:DUF433 domain-containing protein [Gordonia sp. (in: high G+C Gram-positive bacteria)]|uniref:DUF433 domain-containing protein n=1 Tax=Gordonia sp. (in: high G+C Gram-positive bacteria) TaxID=84139 RepID=UPI003341A1EB
MADDLRAVVDKVRDLAVWTDPARCGGEPCIRGTRVFANSVTRMIPDFTDEQICELWPTVQPWQVAILRALGSS